MNEINLFRVSLIPLKYNEHSQKKLIYINYCPYKTNNKKAETQIKSFLIEKLY